MVTRWTLGALPQDSQERQNRLPPVAPRRTVACMNSFDEVFDIPGLAERSGREVLDCPACHGRALRDRPLGVLGGRPDAVRQALLARQWSADVVLFAHTRRLTDDEHARLAAGGVRVVPGRVQRFVVDGDRLAGLELDWACVVAPAVIFVGSHDHAPFSAGWERRATVAVLGDRRHGLERLV